MGYKYTEDNEKEMVNFQDWYYRKGDVKDKNGGYNGVDFNQLKWRIRFWFWRKFVK